MRSVLRIMALLLNADRWAMARGAALSVVVLVMGAALLGLSGWFITATGLAGIAGIGIAFDVFRPSAGVRFLALGRAAARYGERLLTHDATLRALARLRVVLLRGYARGDARRLAQLRSETALTRIVSDVDALDGLVLLLVLPIAAAAVTHLIVFAVLAWLVGLPVAAAILAGYIPAAVLVLSRLARRSVAPSTDAEEIGQRLRRGVIDMIRDREALILASRLSTQEDRLLDLDEVERAAARVLDGSERSTAFLMSSLVATVAMGAFLAGASMLDAGGIGPAKAVIGLFVALALAETLLPLRRGVGSIGRMFGAAGRVAPVLDDEPDKPHSIAGTEGPLLAIDLPEIEVKLGAGQAIAIAGPSGVGKTTLLMKIAGLGDDRGIAIKGIRPSMWPETALRDTVGVLLQRNALVAGTIRENLSLAGSFNDNEIWSVLDLVDLAEEIRSRDGLETRLGEGGAGLSGGQSKRLALARTLLREPAILLLDEPTEGLDPTTADKILRSVRQKLPDALIVAAMHRGADHRIFESSIRLKS